MKTLLIALALLATAAPAPTAQTKAPAAEAPGKKLTLLVTGDNRGEIAPCG